MNEARNFIENTAAPLLSKRRVASAIRKSTEYLLGAIAVCLLGVCTAVGQNLPERVSIKLPDGGELNFRAIYLGIDGEEIFASRRVTLGSREPNPQL